MINWLRATAYMLAGRMALRRRMPGQFTIDETNNFRGVRLIQPETKKRFILDKVVTGGMDGRWFEGNNAPPVERFIPKKELPSYEFQGEEFYHGYTGRADDPYSYILGLAFGVSWFYEKWDHWTQGRFNKRGLTRQDRLQVLRLFVSETSKDDDFKASIFMLLEILFTRRWFRHPEGETTNNYYKLVLRSLVDSGDLRAIDKGQRFELAPQGLTTIAAYELEERRHHDTMRQQGRIGWLTAVLIGVGIVQALATFYAPGATAQRPTVAAPLSPDTQ
ncbi:hypothetical protein [Mesorhizobium sp. M0488]|uniref:hypothetical protein n=1 Tax=unclassified Mesorhizobium TaxID=325217 RepID=UPI0033383F23